MAELIETYAIPALVALLTALAGWLGARMRALADRWVGDKTKRAVARTCVKAVEQLYHDLGCEAKRQKAEQAIVEMLAEKGITISELELRMNLEAVVAEFNYCFGGKKQGEQPRFLAEDDGDYTDDYEPEDEFDGEGST